MDNNTNFSIFQDIQKVYFPNEIIFNLILSFFYGLLISFVYKKTHKGMSYSQSFMITNIFLSVIVCMVIMTIGNSVSRAFALVGALSIIRFRTVIKDTKDIVYIFWSLAAGMACGTGNYFLALMRAMMSAVFDTLPPIPAAFIRLSKSSPLISWANSSAEAKRSDLSCWRFLIRLRESMALPILEDDPEKRLATLLCAFCTASVAFNTSCCCFNCFKRDSAFLRLAFKDCSLVV